MEKWHIRSKGGIDKIRKSVVNAETKKQMEMENKVYRNEIESAFVNKQALGAVQFGANVSTQIAAASDVTFTYLMCINDPKTGLQVVSAIYPNLEIEKLALETSQLTLLAAAYSDKPSFHQFCKENGLNMDLVHRWMKSNGLATAKEARALAKKVHLAAKSKLQSSSVAPASIQLNA